MSWRGNRPVSVTAVAACEKPSNSGTSGQGAQQTPQDARQEGARLTVELVCQDGTKAHDPFRDAPRLVPAFVTQLLGQVLADATRPMPRLVYGTAPVSAALLLDTRV